MITQVVLASTMCVTTCYYTSTTRISDRFLSAICQVESNCTEGAVGDGGKAIGPYQIWYAYWKDAVEYDRSIGGSYRDCLYKGYSEKIVRAYMARYAIQRRLGRPVTDQDRARIHNGGPNGYNKTATVKYWKKVQNVLKGKS